MAGAFLHPERHKGSSALDVRTFEQLDARLDRVESLLDGMSLEVERVLEGQRFTTKLLAEQRDNRAQAPRPLTSPLPSITPH
ncbi:MAG: hypothetical protein M3081_14040 [Gemmatimonadota bacterium]|nr:hypothetical protein [Gemmatimonadota bacterium]